MAAKGLVLNTGPSKTESKEVLDFGFFLLNFDNESISEVKDMISIVMKKSADNKKNYTLALVYKKTGLAVCCNYTLPNEDYIDHYCNHAKYIHKLDKWFGCVFHDDILKPVLKLDFPFLQSDEMDKQIQQVKLVNPSSTGISK